MSSRFLPHKQHQSTTFNCHVSSHDIRGGAGIETQDTFASPSSYVLNSKCRMWHYDPCAASDRAVNYDATQCRAGAQRSQGTLPSKELLILLNLENRWIKNSEAKNY